MRKIAVPGYIHPYGPEWSVDHTATADHAEACVAAGPHRGCLLLAHPTHRTAMKTAPNHAALVHAVTAIASPTIVAGCGRAAMAETSARRKRAAREPPVMRHGAMAPVGVRLSNACPTTEPGRQCSC